MRTTGTGTSHCNRFRQVANRCPFPGHFGHVYCFFQSRSDLEGRVVVNTKRISMRIVANILLSLFLLIGTVVGMEDCSTCPMVPAQATCHGDTGAGAAHGLAKQCCCELIADDRAADEYEGLTEIRGSRVNAAMASGITARWESHPADAVLFQRPAGVPGPRSVALYRLKSSFLI